MLPMLKARYRARAKSWALGEAGTGTPQVGIEFEIEDGDHKGERISYYGFLTDNAAEYALQSLRNCGWTGNDITTIEAPDSGVGANVVELVVQPEDQVKDNQPVHDENTGEVKQRLRVQFVNRAGGLAMKSTLTEDKKTALAAKMKAKLAAIDAKSKRESNGAEPIPAGPPPGHPAAQDDIPF